MPIGARVIKLANSRRAEGFMAKRGGAVTAPKAGSSPLGSALIVLAAVTYGVVLLVQKGRMTWPPYQFLGSLLTLFGCLGLVGPLILFRRVSGQAFLGELIWLACGILIWMQDLASLARGDWRAVAWATPLSHQAIGLTALAVAIAGWRCGVAAISWTWTNVLGFILAIFWVGMGLWAVGASPSSRPASVARSLGVLDGLR